MCTKGEQFDLSYALLLLGGYVSFIENISLPELQDLEYVFKHFLFKAI